MRYLKIFENFTDRKLIWIHGLPGSGKTTLANSINKNNDYVILDDIANFSDVIKELDKNSNIILTSPYFEYYHKLYNNPRKLVEALKNYKNYELEEIWFENDPIKCIENLKNRKNHKISSMSIIPEISYYSSRYKIPASAKTVPVWSN